MKSLSLMQEESQNCKMRGLSSLLFTIYFLFCGRNKPPYGSLDHSFQKLNSIHSVKAVLGCFNVYLASCITQRWITVEFHSPLLNLNNASSDNTTK